ncbi:hypothetical protein NQ317_001190 [Molorchus minor]|uniref:Uncharacterized protein n=1 Tax=Molorchus minor TaxID=1323400 RepID=A0ABQ9J113_9CUCU|nr:hypothetical protein NQ317_001190 [Molorchus minor]
MPNSARVKVGTVDEFMNEMGWPIFPSLAITINSTPFHDAINTNRFSGYNHSSKYKLYSLDDFSSIYYTFYYTSLMFDGHWNTKTDLVGIFRCLYFSYLYNAMAKVQSVHRRKIS